MRLFIREGVHPGDVIALCFDRGVSQILGILAVLKAGPTFVPLDPDDPTLCKEWLKAEFKFTEFDLKLRFASCFHTTTMARLYQCKTCLKFFPTKNLQVTHTRRECKNSGTVKDWFGKKIYLTRKEDKHFHCYCSQHIFSPGHYLTLGSLSKHMTGARARWIGPGSEVSLCFPFSA